MAKTPRGGAGKKGKSRLAEVRRIVSEDGLTILDVFPAVAGMSLVGAQSEPDPANPCTEQSAGILYCDGTDMKVKPFPPGDGPWIPVIVGGAPDFVNGVGIIPANVIDGGVEGAPTPRPAGNDQAVM